MIHLVLWAYGLGFLLLWGYAAALALESRDIRRKNRQGEKP